MFFVVFFLQAEDGIRDLVRSRGLGDVYKRQGGTPPGPGNFFRPWVGPGSALRRMVTCVGLSGLGLSLIHI